MKQAYIYINYPNIVVLQSYLEVVQKALIQNGYTCEFVKSLEGIDREALIVHPMGIDAFKYYWKGYKNFILWQQGATADESFMRNHSKLRYWILNMIDTFAMKKAKFILFVSEYMRMHYEKLSGESFSDKSYTMPCFNEEYDESVYKHKDYRKKVFTYVGSLDLWQCFDKTAALYKQIEERVPNTLFKVLTFSVDEAKRILKEKGVKNYVVACVPKEKVKKELLGTTYGFILREDNMGLRDFYDASKGCRCVMSIPQNYNIQKIIEFVGKWIEENEVKDEFHYLLNGHYSPVTHINNITRQLASIL